MGGDPVVSATHVGKRYRLGEFRRGYGLLTEAFTERIKGLGARRDRRPEFWALRDVSFEVEQGETVGIIGHNGAGKSTLLKILSRITAPTTGEIRIRGRVGALLEVGTGFHLELTGRENVYLNGAVLGMSKAEITAKFDEIVAFAEVEEFIDTPVKRYSTGMHLRLAFAVAAHLDPEILIIDEVLSVGDLAFQEKCLGRMEAAASEGRTILFVSHNLTAVRSFCDRCMLLSAGRKVMEGAPERVIDTYVQGVRGAARTSLAESKDRAGTGRLRFREIALEANGEEIDSPATGQSFDLVLRYGTADGGSLRNVSFAVWMTTENGQMILHLSSRETGTLLHEIPGEGEVRCRLPRCPLPAGQYMLSLWADIGGEALDCIEPAFELTVQEGDFFGSGQAQHPSTRSILIDHSWSVARVIAADERAARTRDEQKAAPALPKLADRS
jgi:lipopolysaccharide transport system ATP-binding protein